MAVVSNLVIVAAFVVLAAFGAGLVVALIRLSGRPLLGPAHSAPERIGAARLSREKGS
jgi:hypothetical protein